MTILAIDPGPTQSAFVLFDGATVTAHGIVENHALMTRAWFSDADAVVLEQIESFGMAVGAEVFETVFWTGRLFQQAYETFGIRANVQRLPRRAVKLHLCQNMRAKDTNIRQALIDRFGGLEKARGKKAAPGPLYGLKADEWSALAIAVTWWDTRRPVEQLQELVKR